MSARGGNYVFARLRGSAMRVNNQLLSERETSSDTGVSLKTLQYWRWAGHPDGPPFVKIGRRVYYRQSDLELWIAEAPTFKSTEKAQTHSLSRGDATMTSDLLELDAKQASFDLTLDLIATLDRRELGAVGRATVVANLLAHLIQRDGPDAACKIVGEVLQ
jgi:predicted DNA-binding transcriptional regulator AlpA